ncbi:hypothetical protein V1520DRAFT_337994 [Lipomyces starkeyi]
MELYLTSSRITIRTPFLLSMLISTIKTTRATFINSRITRCGLGQLESPTRFCNGRSHDCCVYSFLSVFYSM